MSGVAELTTVEKEKEVVIARIAEVLERAELAYVQELELVLKQRIEGV